MMLKIQKLDKRMSGHQYYMYRLEFQTYKFNDGAGPGSAYKKCVITFNDMCRHLTSVFGYGPNVDDVHIYADHFKEAPDWGFRPPSNTHTATIYMADDAAKTEVEKLLVFLRLAQV